MLLRTRTVCQDFRARALGRVLTVQRNLLQSTPCSVNLRRMGVASAFPTPTKGTLNLSRQEGSLPRQTGVRLRATTARPRVRLTQSASKYPPSHFACRRQRPALDSHL